jgi:hypothetical protein
LHCIRSTKLKIEEKHICFSSLAGQSLDKVLVLWLSGKSFFGGPNNLNAYPEIGPPTSGQNDFDKKDYNHKIYKIG